MKTEIQNGPMDWIVPKDAACGLYIDSKGSPVLVGLHALYTSIHKYMVRFPDGNPCTYEIEDFPYKLREVAKGEQIIITGE